MKASLNNSISKLTTLNLALFVLLMSSPTHADETIVQNPQPQFATATPSNHDAASPLTSRVPHTVFPTDQGMPLAREDVDLTRTAVVPGRAFVPSTTPRETHPTYTPITPRYQPAPQYNQPAPKYQQPTIPQYNQPAPQSPQTPAGGELLGNNKPTDPQVKISSRNTDPKMLGFLRTTSMQELTSLYHEASRMIDAKHVNPPAYETRMKSSLNNLILALDNPDFQRANNLSSQSTAIRQVQAELAQTINSQPARNATEAVGLMQWSAELVNRQLGVRREAVALEFMNGTIDALDKYSSFMPESTAFAPGAELKNRKTASLEENIVGIGVELETHPMGAILVGVVENSPASGLGLKKGDLIVAVNGQSVRGLGLNTVAGKLGGSLGTQITLDIERDGQRYRGQLSRQRIYVSSVTGTEMLDNIKKVGYVRLKQFSESSRKDLEAAMWSLHNQGMKSLVLDLRGNPGGLLDQAIEVSDLFLPCGTIVSTKGRNYTDNTSETATREKTWSIPLVVLVDDGSASASEIFAAAIQENERGVVVGRHSYGKGTVQTHFPLQTVSGLLKLTTAKFYSPAGREMAGSGVTPDLLVRATETNSNRADYDADIEAAISVVDQGIPNRLAQQAANCNQPKYQTPGQANNSFNNFTQQLQMNMSGR